MSSYRVSVLRLRRHIEPLLASQSAPPVDLDPILASLGAELRILDLEPDLSAILYQDASQRVIVANAGQDPSGRRFAIARQLGHLVLHKGEEVRIDDGARVNLADSRKADLEDLEALEATWFALELLMPQAWITEDLDNEALDLQQAAAVDEIASRYQVAVHLATFRLVTLFA